MTKRVNARKKQKDQASRDVAACRLAEDYLLAIAPVTRQLLERYQTISDSAESASSIPGIYRQLVLSAQNRNMSASVIGRSIGGIGRLGKVLCRFHPASVVRKYGADSRRLLSDIVTRVRPAGKVRRGPRSIWPQFCRSVLSGAVFLSQFESAADFCSWVEFFDGDERARGSLPMLIATEVDGIGFALACDFLKELGFLNFSKPDRHLKYILPKLGLSESDDDYTMFKAISRIARNSQRTPYAVDKLFWLIGSGNFYHDGFSIGRNRKAFVSSARRRLS
jgi:hypothetical protein